MELLEIEERLTETMTEEISLFSHYRDEFQNMKELVMDKNWVKLQSSIDRVNHLSRQIEKADGQRDDIYQELLAQTGAEEGESFYSLISRVYGEAGRPLQDIYRIIRHEIRSVKVMSEGFNRFLNNRTSLVKEIMEELVPDRRGSIYNRRGIASHDSGNSSLVLNRHL